MPKESNHWDLVRFDEFYPGLSTFNPGDPVRKERSAWPWCCRRCEHTSEAAPRCGTVRKTHRDLPGARRAAWSC